MPAQLTAKLPAQLCEKNVQSSRYHRNAITPLSVQNWMVGTDINFIEEPRRKLMHETLLKQIYKAFQQQNVT